jgi:hypothetical protein
MFLRTLAGRLSLVVLGLSFLAVPSPAQEERKPAQPAPKLRFSGPHTQDNLTIFLIHGPDRIQDKNLLTLDEALEKKLVVVHETGDVNQLSVENVSADHSVFIQACDIVKGGQQDRILAHDLLLPPKSGKVAIASFCCESNRWAKRGAEDEKTFGSSKSQAATNDVKLACRRAMSQRVVWDNVGKAQKNLSEKVGGDVRSPESASSLQLTLENVRLQAALEGRYKKLTGILDGKDDVIGYAVVINGKVVGVDIYASSMLFKKLWDKQLRTACVEAVAEYDGKLKFEVPKSEAIEAFMADLASGKEAKKDVGKRLQEMTNETKKGILFSTLDRDNKNVPLRQCYLAF